MLLNFISDNISGPPYALSHRGEKCFKKGQLQGPLKQLNLEQDSGFNAR